MWYTILISNQILKRNSTIKDSQMQEKNITIVTGSSSGIGAGIVTQLASLSYEPVVTFKTDSIAAQEIAAKISGNKAINSYHLDLSSDESIETFVKDIKSRYDHIDTLVCNAGVDYHHNSFEEIDVSEWREIFEVKVFGNFSLIKKLLPLLQKSKNPNIIFISASLANRPDPFDPAYSSASSAVNTFADSLVYALKDYSIRTNIICPGPMDTNLAYWKSIKEQHADIFDSLKKSNPLGLLTEPSDVAAIINTIVETKIINGNTFFATGGTHLRP